ncbi:unnamed protein product [Rangifer tarandus platyrhynchus]|uniref:Uncharacterized protein n=1 Tax=Rangifer tarandus platyrhynchus TaxID=3082113 RepID=A0ABN8ZBD5_RANTA|nr:unnamed protein product [Rangifer tarandus platyrhynchus]
MNTLKVKSLSRVRLFATPWTVVYQAPPSMGFSRQECWSGLPFPSNPQGSSVSLMSRVTPDLLKLDQPLSRCKDQQRPQASLAQVRPRWSDRLGGWSLWELFRGVLRDGSYPG